MARISIFFALLPFTFYLSCNGTKERITPTVLEVQKTVQEEKSQAKNIILMIGDGMGLTQITAGMYAQGNHTALEKVKTVGLHKCHASNKLVTDSAAGATAFASGVKTYNGAIGVGPDKESVPTILEEAEEMNKATGLVATSTIVHATPASFFAHNESRSNYESIAEDMLDVEVDYFVGGGKKFFSSRESDDRNIVSELKDKGYYISDFVAEDFSVDIIPDNGNFGYLTSNENPLMASQGRDYLLDASMGAIQFLDRQKEDGFFLMIEGSQIDWGGHANDPEYVVSEFIEFDAVIKAVLQWAEKDGETLVVITADHETGGLALQPDSKMDSLSFAFTSTYHTGTMIPVFAYGPGENTFGGIYENIAIYDKMRKAFGWKESYMPSSGKSNK